MKFIIDFAAVANDSDITDYFAENKCEIIKIYNSFLRVYLVNSESTPPTTGIVESIINDDDITISPLGEIVSVNQYYHLPNPNYPSSTISTTDEKDWWKNYVLLDPDFDNPTVNVSRKGNGVSVYIMDSGIEETHTEFSDSTIVNLFSITDNYTDTSGHGTAIASIISGKTCGLSNATLKIVKIFDKNQPTKQSDMLNALDSILGDFSNNNNQAAILNCSWHIAKNSYIESKFLKLISQGISVVASAGNSGVPIETVTPASMPEVLTIGSYGLNFEPSDFSNYSNSSVISNTANTVNSGQLNGWAPGEQIWVAALDGSYGYCSGTSISAAIHSCVLAYNTSDILLGGNTKPGVFQPGSIFQLSEISMLRRGLMDLSDPKYANSTNRISTLINKLLHESIDLDYYEFHTYVGSNKIIGQIYNPQITKHVEIINPLPPGFYIMTSGQIGGIADSISSSYQIFNSLVRITDTNDVVRDTTLVIAILSPEFDKTQVPAGDPILQINLDAANCSNNSACPTGILTGISCTNDCTSTPCNSSTCKTPATRKNCTC
jgi:hypothetical protein